MRRLVRSFATVVAAALVLTGIAVEPAGALPGQPVIVAPAFNSDAPANPVLEWQAVADATTYEVEVNTRADYLSTTRKWSLPTTYNTKATPLVDLPVGTLYWRVRSRNTSGFSDWTTSQFNRAAAPGPTLVSPTSGTQLTYPTEPLLFKWSGLAGVEEYEFDISSDPNFTSSVPTVTTNTAFSLLKPLPINQTHYWRVRGVSATGVTTQWSVANAVILRWPTVPTLLTPADSVSQFTEEVEVSWSAVPGAAAYDLQISPNGDWANNLAVDAKNVLGTRYAPAKTLEAGSYFWRVRARSSTSTTDAIVGNWSNPRAFYRQWPRVPVEPRNTCNSAVPYSCVELSTPADNEVVTTEVVYRWSPVRLASSYEIQLSRDANFSPSQIIGSCVTNHTTYVPYYSDGCINLDVQAGSGWYWRVRPLDGPAAEILGVWTPARRVVWDPPAPKATDPSSLWVENNGSYTPTVRWAPILNRSTFQIKVYNGTGGLELTNTVVGTSWTSKTLLDPGTYKVAVIPMDVQNRAQGDPFDAFKATMVVGSAPAGGSSVSLLSPGNGTTLDSPPVFTWTPVTGADVYRVYFVTQGNGQLLLSDQSGPLHATAFSAAHIASLVDGSYAWKVIPFTATGTELPGSAVQSFTLNRGSYTGTAVSPNHCTAQAPCQAEFETPYLDWQSEYGVEAWLVYIATDPQFTNMVTDDGGPESTPHTSIKFTYSLKDSQAGQSFYWYARPCGVGFSGCGPEPQVPTVAANIRAFRKSSAPVELVSPANNATVADQVTFDWTEFLLTNRKPAYNVNQEALYYQVTINTSPDFAPSTEVHTSVKLDATTYTAPNDLLPEGQLYWRVQSFDGSRNPLTVSETRLVNKASARPVLQEPADGSTIGNQLVFRWGAEAFTAEYELEVYKNPDQPIADANRVLTKKVRTNSFAPTEFLTGGPNFGWRVRRISASPGRPGPWSAANNTELRRFVYGGPTPDLADPSDGAVLPNGKNVVRWQAVVGAGAYRVDISTNPTFPSPVYETAITVMTAFAPTKQYPAGTYYWRVTALTGVSSSARTLGTSAVWSFKIDSSTKGEFFPLAPYRLLDTRDVGKTSIKAAQTINLNVRVAAAGVPASGVGAVVVNVTATGATAPSYFTVWPTGDNKPTASNLNFVAGQTIPNLVTVKVGANGNISIYNHNGSAHAVVDIVGWFGDGTNQRGARFTPAPNPTRIYDSRSSGGQPDPLLPGPAYARVIQVAGVGANGAPANASAVVMNVTAVARDAGYLTVYPNPVNPDTPPPTASNLNFTAGEIIPNLVVVRVGANQSVKVLSNGKTDFLFDVVGWFVDGQPDNPAQGTRLAAINPCRALDTRNTGFSALTANVPRTVKVTGDVGGCLAANLPATGVKGVVLNVTVVAPTAAGYAAVWPEGTFPGSSNLNYTAGKIIPNLVMTRVSSTGTVQVMASGGTANIIVDVVGWYGEP